ncbi:mammalian DNA polymerase-like protein [Perilla frutescens var. frutescens]|nr:mammalian DNA polymerase-like protein [Perilla frutescens var. frutescens]
MVGNHVPTTIRSMQRDFFVPTQEDWVLLTADYCPIELRLMAHFSKDSSLIELLTSPQADLHHDCLEMERET